MYFCGNLSEKEGGDQSRTKEEINTARTRGGSKERREGWREKRTVDGRARAIIDLSSKSGGEGGEGREKATETASNQACERERGCHVWERGDRPILRERGEGEKERERERERERDRAREKRTGGGRE